MKKCDKFCLRQNFPSAWDSESFSIEKMIPYSDPHICSRSHGTRSYEDYYYKEQPVEYKPINFNHTLAVLTAPRPVSMLKDTLVSLHEGGAGNWKGQRFVFSDGPLAKTDYIRNLGWSTVDSQKISGCASSFIDLLIRCLIQNPRLEYLTFVEDDVEVSRNALNYIRHVDVPKNIAFISWFTTPYDWSSPRHNEHPSSVIGRPKKEAIFGVRPSRYFIMTQTITFPRRTIDRLLRCPKITTHWPKKHGFDEMIAHALGDDLYATHFPGIVQHLGGLNSAVVMQKKEAQALDEQMGERKSPYYLGPDFDALLLLRGK